MTATTARIDGLPLTSDEQEIERIARWNGASDEEVVLEVRVHRLQRTERVTPFGIRIVDGCEPCRRVGGCTLHQDAR